MMRAAEARREREAHTEFTRGRDPGHGNRESDPLRTGSGWQPGLRNRSRKESEVLGGIGFLTTLGVGVGFFRPTPTTDVELNHFLHHTRGLGIPVEMVQFLLKLLLQQRFLAVYHDFH